MTHFLTIGLMLGLSAGLSPGPLLTLVISESFRHGIVSGVKVAVAPIITDLPVILLALFIVSKLSGANFGLGIISLTGGLFILFTGCECMRTKPVAANLSDLQPKSLLKGIVANILNPHPYLFWISVGVPTMSSAVDQNGGALAAFVIGFYLALVGSKVILAVTVGRSRSFLSGNIYLYTLRFLGLLLCAFAFVLFRDGAKLLGMF